jgi:hypothetical protein
MTPRASSSGVSCAILLNAPRSLKENTCAGAQAGCHAVQLVRLSALGILTATYLLHVFTLQQHRVAKLYRHLLRLFQRRLHLQMQEHAICWCGQDTSCAPALQVDHMHSQAQEALASHRDFIYPSPQDLPQVVTGSRC